MSLEGRQNVLDRFDKPTEDVFSFLPKESAEAPKIQEEPARRISAEVAPETAPTLVAAPQPAPEVATPQTPLVPPPPPPQVPASPLPLPQAPPAPLDNSSKLEKFQSENSISLIRNSNYSDKKF